MEYRQCARTALCDDRLCIEPFAHDQQRISLFKLRGHGRAQRSGRKHGPIADPAARIDYRKRKIFQQRWILQAIIHDDQPCTLLVRKRGTGNAVPRHDSRRAVRNQKRFVANLGGTVSRGHPHALVRRRFPHNRD